MTMSRVLRFAAILSLSAGVAVATAAAQPAPQQPPDHDDDHGMAPSVPDRYAEPIELFKVSLGLYTRAISSTNPEARTYFNQAVQME